MLMYSCRLVAGTRFSLTIRHQVDLGRPLLHVRCGRVASRLSTTKIVAGLDDLPAPKAPQGILTPHGSANRHLTDSQLLQARKYVRLVLDQNTTMNLTGTQPLLPLQPYFIQKPAVIPCLGFCT